MIIFPYKEPVLSLQNWHPNQINPINGNLWRTREADGLRSIERSVALANQFPANKGKATDVSCLLRYLKVDIISNRRYILRILATCQQDHCKIVSGRVQKLFGNLPTSSKITQCVFLQQLRRRAERSPSLQTCLWFICLPPHEMRVKYETTHQIFSLFGTRERLLMLIIIKIL